MSANKHEESDLSQLSTEPEELPTDRFSYMRMLEEPEAPVVTIYQILEGEMEDRRRTQLCGGNPKVFLSGAGE